MQYIDSLPLQFRSAEVVYLSNNSLSSLHGLQQLQAVKVLSLSNNLVADEAQLDVLARCCPALRVLALHGNPIASHPRYRALVLQRLPWLTMLDNQVGSSS